jgi:bifunctional non-homologous end joining protein LigD
MPIAWDELPQVKSGAHWTIRNAREHLSLRKRDPWTDYSNQSQSLTEAMSILSFVPKRKNPV